HRPGSARPQPGRLGGRPRRPPRPGARPRQRVASRGARPGAAQRGVRHRDRRAPAPGERSADLRAAQPPPGGRPGRRGRRLTPSPPDPDHRPRARCARPCTRGSLPTMTRTRVPFAGAAALLAAGALALAGCGTTESPEETNAGGGDTDGATSAAPAGPVTYTDERGEHTLDAPAEDVVALEWGLTENLLALGVEPIGQADVKGYNTWNTSAPLDPATEDVGMRGEPSLSAITALEPALSVTTTDVPANVIDQLEEIAPVLAMRGSASEDPLGYMRKTVETLAVATGTEDRAEELLAEFDAKLEEGR